MKLRAVFNRQREVVELIGDVITLGNCRETVCSKFGLRTNSFDLSLNGRDFLVDDSVSLTDLGIVNGDLIYVVPNTLQPEEAQSSQPTACSSSNVRVHTKVTQQDHLVQHAGSSAEVSTVASTSHCSQTDLHPSNREKAGNEKQSQQQMSFAAPLRPYVLLCRDGIPEALQELYRCTDVGTIHEAAWVVVHFLMLETGYNILREDSTEITNAEKPDRIVPPVDWKKGGIARIQYTHANCPGLTCSLTFTSLGPHVMIHGLADSVPNSEVYQCRLQPTDFVRGNVDLKASGASSVYYNLHRLSRLVKDQVSYPLLSFMRAALGLPQLCGLMALPAEVKLMILGRLPVHCIIQVSCTCRELYSLANDSTLWQHLVLRDFGRIAKEQTRNWKEEYISLYKQRQTQEQLAKQVVLPSHEVYPHGYFIGPQPSRGDTYPPGIIGGHGDLFPNLPFIPGGFNPAPGFPPGVRPGVGLPRPRFDPFGPLPDMNHIPGPPRRGPHPAPRGSFPPGFL